MQEVPALPFFFVVVVVGVGWLVLMLLYYIVFELQLLYKELSMALDRFMWKFI